ncbi:hypothetical protein [Stenotrophobium rhamnosiphilum]|uniref:Uncharacterized protein n=1 Tax=Stenotrophobium rhamnosiphilum TaxID=2029166 RepID=A0A2T5MEW6_9GAMM|nr:hypothetical protein [Stenotrophobium rhamnosiphilum]PTU31131.1 hypothetical protein CJD38_12640 [Stenotrophobium rhamnosiphilum]
MNKLFHIGINFYGRNPKHAELSAAFDKALSWVRYAPNCWVVLSSSDGYAWFHRLKPLLHDDDSILICEIPMQGERTGFLPKLVWDWLEKQTGSKTILDVLPRPALTDQHDLNQNV